MYLRYGSKYRSDGSIEYTDGILYATYITAHSKLNGVGPPITAPVE